MKFIDQVIAAPYLEQGRTLDGLDCWGLVLLGRASLGLTDLPSIGAVDRHTVHAMQTQYRKISYQLQPVDRPKPGDLAAVFRANVFVHVGLVIEVEGRKAVIETNPKTGVRWMFLERFLEVNYKVAFYSDRNLPE